MSPRWFLGLGYLFMALAWLHLGLLAWGEDKPLHMVLPLVQAGGAFLAAIATIFMPRVIGLVLQGIGVAVFALASGVLTGAAAAEGRLFTVAHATQTFGLLYSLWYAVVWWLNSGLKKYARRFALGYLLATLGALAMIVLEFLDQGHPFIKAKIPFAAGDDGLLALGCLLASWMGGLSAMTLKTPLTLPDE